MLSVERHGNRHDRRSPSHLFKAFFFYDETPGKALFGASQPVRPSPSAIAAVTLASIPSGSTAPPSDYFPRIATRWIRHPIYQNCGVTALN